MTLLMIASASFDLVLLAGPSVRKIYRKLACCLQESGFAQHAKRHVEK